MTAGIWGILIFAIVVDCAIIAVAFHDFLKKDKTESPKETENPVTEPKAKK